MVDASHSPDERGSAHREPSLCSKSSSEKCRRSKEGRKTSRIKRKAWCLIFLLTSESLKKVTETVAAQVGSYFEEQQSSSSGGYTRWFAAQSREQSGEGDSPSMGGSGCSKSYHSGGRGSMLLKTPQADEAVVAVVAGDAIYILRGGGMR